MNTIEIKTMSKTYPVYIGEHTIQLLPSFLKEQCTPFTKLFIITDEKVAGLYLPALLKELADFQPLHYIVPEGENAKTFEVYYQCLTFALENSLDRRAVVLALGGGAVGDLAGFVAASYMRGLRFIQLPTTLLAHDSAVGGKVAINHPKGKNMIGTFFQPEAVIYDTDFLQSLNKREQRSGFAELVKEAFIHDGPLLTWLLDHVNAIEAISQQEWETLLSKGIKIKNAFVSQDEKEAGVRAFLNFGHTLGHAIEAEMGYGNFSHGESVMVGLLFALQLSKKKYQLPFDSSAYIRWLEKLGYQTVLSSELSVEKLIARMYQDKKTVGRDIRFVLLKQIGEPVLTAIAEKELWEELVKFQGERESKVHD
ncbi:3-dehydroquinate synthase [Bacillaceae bacterium Marseille-Q3522]|nr:3-dehydroquinate synthase [Bacillaceae bacterium Marseille-Q3522]